ncbi:MAG: PE-PPE domain-containing protein [Gordonia sp. (in: high G+C Gram-positive bacteria)]|uniref:PE-PPE domain-containing protein n=1 Tax=Gordonia sp. (in: high G+C Gram-positive bacteria) TaxID=84139 RepID=UPI0039E2AA76
MNTREITVLAVGGTGESYPDDTRTTVSGMLSSVTDALDDRFTARWVPYPASYGPVSGRDADCYRLSVARGVANLSAAIDAASGSGEHPVMLIGYSQGAVVIRTLLSHPSAERLRSRIAAVGFVADPHQPPGVVPGCDGWGVAGPGPAIPEDVPAYWVGTPDDVICNASPDSLIRDLADLTGTLSARHLPEWLSDAAARAFGAATQNATSTRIAPQQWRRDVHRLLTAAREAGGWLPRGLGMIRNPLGGRHVSYASEPYGHAPLTDPDVTGCEDLAHWLQVQATLGLHDEPFTALPHPPAHPPAHLPGAA